MRYWAFADDKNYSEHVYNWWGGNYYCTDADSSNSESSWSATPRGNLVLDGKFYNILYRTSSDLDTQKYQIYFKGNLYPSSSDSVTAESIGTWNPSFLKSKDPAYGSSLSFSDTAIDVYVSASETDSFTYIYKTFSGTLVSSKISNGDLSSQKFKDRKGFISGEKWYLQSAVWKSSDGCTLEYAYVDSNTGKFYSLTYGGKTYDIKEAGDLGSGKYILLASDSSGAKTSFILEGKIDGTVTVVSVDEESDSTKVKTLSYDSRYGYRAENYVSVTLSAEQNVLSKTVSDIVKSDFSDYDYVTEPSISVNLPKNKKVKDVLDAFSSYKSDNVKIGCGLVAKAGSEGSAISSGDATVEGNTDIYIAKEKVSGAFYVTYKIPSSLNEKFTEPTSSSQSTGGQDYYNYKKYDYELSSDRKTLKVLVLPDTSISSCVTDFIKHLDGNVTYKKQNGTEVYSSDIFSSVGITSDKTLNVSFKTAKNLNYVVYYKGKVLGPQTGLDLSFFTSQYALEKGTDYTVDEDAQTITLTESGYKKYMSE